MTINVAINGYGRIGRMVLRALYEDQVNGKPRRDIKIVAINAMGDIAINAHLTQYDSAHGRFPAQVSVDGDCMVVNGDRIKMFSTRNPAETPWGELGVDLVLECTGHFTSKKKGDDSYSTGCEKSIDFCSW
jgi:glyceraldehyde 3-phosphate dehydrogenase